MRDTNGFHLLTRPSLFTAVGVLPLRLTFQHCSANMLFSILVLHSVPSLLSLFKAVEQTTSTSRRVPSDLLVLQVPLVRTERAKNSFAYWGAVLWNSIPTDIRRCQSYAAFSSLYLTYLRSKLDLAVTDNYRLLNFL